MIRLFGFKKIIAAGLSLVLAFTFFSTGVLAEGEADRAARFVSAVEEFSELSDLDARKSHLASVKSADVYFDDVSYEGVAEALSLLAEHEARINEAVGNCDAFIDAVGSALLVESDDYSALKTALTEAAKYLSKLDSTYDGIPGAKSDYQSMAGELTLREKYMEEFLKLVGSMSALTDYETRLEAFNDAEDYIAGEEFIEDYPGVAEALALLDEADTMLEEAVAAASEFVSLVNALGLGDDIASELLAAYAALAELDVTAPGVSLSKTILNAATEGYNEKVRGINEDWGNL